MKKSLFKNCQGFRKKFKIKDNVYKTELTVTFKKLPVNEGGVFYIKGGKYFIDISIDVDEKEVIGLFFHEVIHYAVAIFCKSGIVIDKKNDEAFAFFCEWVLNEIFTKGLIWDI